MKAIRWLVFLSVCAPHLHADEPAIAFYVVEGRQLQSLAARGSPHDIREDKLREVARLSGYLIGSAFSVTTSETSLSVSIDSWGEPDLIYRVSSFSGRERKPVIQLSGIAKGDGRRYVTDNWQQAEFVVMLRYVNLKK